MERLKTFLKKVDPKIDFDSQMSYAFFITFSRFEYALKNCRYLKVNPNDPKAESDWDAFARANETRFNPGKNTDLSEAVKYFNAQPPKQQIIQNGGLNWRDSAPANNWNGRQLEWLLIMIRRIRNNLFHGGKYPNFMVAEPSRNRELIKNSLVILYECLELENRMADNFYEDI